MFFCWLERERETESALFLSALFIWPAEGAEWFSMRLHFLSSRNYLQGTEPLCALLILKTRLKLPRARHRNRRGSCKIKIGCCGGSRGVQCVWCNSMHIQTLVHQGNERTGAPSVGVFISTSKERLIVWFHFITSAKDVILSTMRRYALYRLLYDFCLTITMQNESDIYCYYHTVRVHAIYSLVTYSLWYSLIWLKLDTSYRTAICDYFLSSIHVMICLFVNFWTFYRLNNL